MRFYFCGVSMMNFSEKTNYSGLLNYSSGELEAEYSDCRDKKMKSTMVIDIDIKVLYKMIP